MARILIVILFLVGPITLLSDNASFFNQEPILKELPAATGSAESDYKVANASYVRMYNQLQFMQEEFFRLQGKIEKLENEIKQLKSKQLDDYISLDKRLQSISKGGGIKEVVPVAQPITTPKSTSPITSDLYVEYKKAFALVKERRFPEAKKAFDTFIKANSDDPLAGNAYYWLGELYILDKDYSQAEVSFKKIISEFPSHNKVPEAIYKLGRIYFDKGNKVEAKQQMQFILNRYKGQNLNAVKLAEDFLRNNF